MVVPCDSRITPNSGYSVVNLNLAKFTGGNVWSPLANPEFDGRECELGKNARDDDRKSSLIFGSSRPHRGSEVGIIHEFKSKRRTPHWLRPFGSRGRESRPAASHRFSAHSPSAINNCAGPMCRKQYFTRFNPPVTAAISGPAVNCRLSQPGSTRRTKFRMWCEIIMLLDLQRWRSALEKRRVIRFM